MKRFRRLAQLLLTGAVAGGALTVAAGAAHASSPPYLAAYGGPNEVWASGDGFAAYATVRVEVLTPSWQVLATQYPQTNGYGDLGMDFYSLGYTGSVYVLADQLAPAPSVGTVGAQTNVSPNPAFLYAGQGGCATYYPVNTEAYGFEPWYGVRFELMTNDLSRVLSTANTSASNIGDAYATLSTAGYTGWAWVVADEVGNGPSGFIPAPATTWDHIYVC
jgi:hypothetical protein